MALALLNIAGCPQTAITVPLLQMLPQIPLWKGSLKPKQRSYELVADCQLLCFCSIQGLLKKPVCDPPSNPIMQQPCKRNSENWDTDVHDHCERLEPICQGHTVPPVGDASGGFASRCVGSREPTHLEANPPEASPTGGTVWIACKAPLAASATHCPTKSTKCQKFPPQEDCCLAFVAGPNCPTKCPAQCPPELRCCSALVSF